jgi:hypothetical protein
MDTPNYKLVNGELVDLTSEEKESILAEWDSAKLPSLPDAENYQVRAWMIRGGKDPEIVPQIIKQVITDAIEQKEALMRWDYAVKIPRDFPLVDIIGSEMNLTPEQIDIAWNDILKL